MAEQGIQEAKETEFDEKVEGFFKEQGDQKTPEDSSTSNKTEDTDKEAEKPAGAEPEKTDQVKAVEDDVSLSVEEKIAKVKEILGDDEKAIDAYIKQKGYHNDPAWQKQREQIDRLKKESEKRSALSEEDAEALKEFKRFRSSPEYIQTSMKAQGYTQEAIEKKLQENGFDVPSKPQDDVKLVIDKLGIKLDDMDNIQQIKIKNNIADIIKVADVLFNDRFSKLLPKELGPIKENMQLSENKTNASKLVIKMKDITKEEGILDFDKDIEPLIDKFIDENPDTDQLGVFEHFKEISRKLSLERLKKGKKQEERNQEKSNLRQNIPGSSGPISTPKRTGNFDSDADAFLEQVNIL